MAHGGTYSWWYSDPGSDNYETGGANAGYLTSPPFDIPAGGAVARFWYRYETEGEGPYWDQRRIQISVAGGPFADYQQLAMDEPNTWLQSPLLDLSPYASQTVQLRFLFITLDEAGNNFQGWGIDDFSVTTDPLPICSDIQEPNDSPGQATSISADSSISGDICGPGDVDYFRLTGSQSDRIVVDVDAEEIGSSLDSYLFLYADDGTTLLASHDDEVLYVRRDSHLGAELPYDGVYYLKLKDWNHPGAGSPDYSYTLTLSIDNEDPQITLTSPSGGGYLTGGEITVEAEASDSQSGISHVSFWYHDSNWAGGSWVSLGEDWDGGDGWTTDFDVEAQAEGTGMSLYAQVQDWAGNVRVAGNWDFGIDRTAPETSIEPLDPVLQTTAVLLELAGSDQVSGLSHYDLQVRGDPPTWQDLQTGLSSSTTGIWFIGEPGGLYDFRSRGTDLAGNVEPYPSDPDTLTFIQSCSGPGPYEPDDTSAEATAISLGDPPQSHNFCQTGDADWLQFIVAAGGYYIVYAAPSHESTAVKIQLYAADGTTLLSETAAAEFGDLNSLGWEAVESGTLFVRLTHINSAVAGDGVTYNTWIANGPRIYMPVVNK
jgi:hypothetical protein